MRTALFALVLATAGASAARPMAHQLAGYTFDSYKKDFAKAYTASEHDMRRGIFERKMAEAIAHNADPAQMYKKGINHLSDRTDAELKRLRGLRLNGKTHDLPIANKWTPTSDMTAPTTLDYRTAVPPVLTAVKDQGNCGSCWAHAATEGIESQYAIKTGRLFDLSQQQIVSCAPDPDECGGYGGCTGGTVEVAWAYVTENGGITEEWMYSYQSYFGTVPVCAYTENTTAVVQTTGYTVTSPRNDANAVMQSLFANGPLAITVDAAAWDPYESGIFNGCDYAKNISMDHAVQLVGYGSDPTLGQDYWIVRNSWSADWGENGFIRLIREATPKCGWDGFGGGCENDPAQVWTCGQCGILFDTAFPNLA